MVLTKKRIMSITVKKKKIRKLVINSNFRTVLTKKNVASV